MVALEDSPKAGGGQDWVDFDSVQFKTNLRRKKKMEKRVGREPDGEQQSSARPDAPSLTPSWMKKPVKSDASWMPIAPPQQEKPSAQTCNDEVRDIPEPRIPRSPAERRRKLRLQQEQQQRHRGEETVTENLQRSPARSASPASDRRGTSPSSNTHRGRSHSRRGSRTVTDAESQRRETNATPKRSHRGRSSSLGRAVDSPRRSRSTSRVRAACGSDAPRQRHVGPRSAQSTPSPRVSSSQIPRGRISNRESVQRVAASGISATRSCAPSTPSSIGPGLPRPNRPPRDSRDDLSHRCAQNLDGNVGRDVAFGTTTDRSEPSTITNQTGRREGSLMQKLFGSQVDPQSREARRRENSSRTLSSENGDCQLPEKLHPRILLSATIYHNAATNLWITTINTNQRGVATNPATAAKFLKAFTFNTEKEARESAIANAPPKMIPFNQHSTCFICTVKFAVFKRACHCRNCGVCICSGCTVQWPSKMIPDTYNLKREKNIRVCLSCDWLSHAFKEALLKGSYEESIALYGSGNVNTRTPFPATKSDKKFETMHPIHCAVEGGNLDVVRWLLEERLCPVKKVAGAQGKKRGQEIPIVTSTGRSVLNIAMARKQIDVLRYLVVDRHVSVWETKELPLALHALEAALDAVPKTGAHVPAGNIEARWADDGYYDPDEESSQAALQIHKARTQQLLVAGVNQTFASYATTIQSTV